GPHHPALGSDLSPETIGSASSGHEPVGINASAGYIPQSSSLTGDRMAPRPPAAPPAALDVKDIPQVGPLQWGWITDRRGLGHAAREFEAESVCGNVAANDGHGTL